MQVDLDVFNKYQEEGLLRSSHNETGLTVWCYTVQAVYERRWDSVTRMCRGLVTDDSGLVISRCLPKFFNWGEPEAPGPEITAGPFWAYDKMDGSLIIVGNRDGEAVVSTKGSFSTWHSEAARELLEGWKPVAGSTGIFELIHPDNRIVVDYGDRKELVLLGAVSNETGEDHFTPENYAEESGWFGTIAPPSQFRLQSILQTVANPESGPNREGFVLVWPNSTGPSHRAKIKFAQYMQLHHTLSRLSNVAVWEALSNDSLEALLDVVPDEMYTQVHECADDLNAKHADLRKRAESVARNAVLLHTTRADQARWILGKTDVVASSLAFLALDGTERSGALDKAVWASIKPARDTSWTFLR